MLSYDLYDLEHPPRVNRIFALIFLLCLAGVVLLLWQVAVLEKNYDMDVLDRPLAIVQPDGTAMHYSGPVGGVPDDPRVGPAALRDASGMAVGAIPLLLLAAVVLAFPGLCWGRFRIFSYDVPAPNALWFWCTWVVAYLLGFGGIGLIVGGFFRLP